MLAMSNLSPSYKGGDVWVNSVQTFLQFIYFYNPFVWFANSIICRVCEQAVDTVLVTLGDQAKNYSNTLIDIGEMAFWRALSFPNTHLPRKLHVSI